MTATASIPSDRDGMQKRQAAAEWRAHWTLVAAAFAGFSLPSLAVNTLGVFTAPIQDEFGWTRAQIAAGVTIVGLLMVPLSPVVGALIDRWGARRLALPGIVAAGATFAGISLADGSTAQWLLLWTLFAMASLFIGSTVWTSAVSNAFTTGRAMALAVMLCGTAFTGAVAPPLAHWLIEGFGWKQAYLLLGLGWSMPVLILAILFFFDRHDRDRQAAAISAAIPTAALEPAPLLDGLSVAEAIRSLPLWRIGIATLIVLGLDVAILVQKVPILTEAGVSRGNAALLAGMSGGAAILGKLVTGWLLDRFDAGAISSATMVLAAIAYAMLLEPFRTPLVIFVSMFLIGYAGGTKLQICAYLTGVYAGMRNFGKIFGVMASIIALAAGVGPILSGWMYDISGSYTPLLIVGTIGCLIAAAMLVRLGKPAWSAAPA